MMVDHRGILRMKPLIKKEAIFNKKCKTHKSCYRNIYCMDCNTKPLCHKCDNENPAGHAQLGHKVIQVTKSTRRNSIKVKEIEKLIDGSDILQLLNNSVLVFMLLTRGKPEENLNAGMKKHCIKCGFPNQTTILQPNARYCSIECKLEDIDMDDLLPKKYVPDSSMTTADSESSFRKTVEDLLPGMPALSPTTGSSEASSRKIHSFRPTRNAPFCCGVKRTHRRKGHPHRAPLH